MRRWTPGAGAPPAFPRRCCGSFCPWKRLMASISSLRLLVSSCPASCRPLVIHDCGEVVGAEVLLDEFRRGVTHQARARDHRMQVVHQQDVNAPVKGPHGLADVGLDRAARIHRRERTLDRHIDVREDRRASGDGRPRTPRNHPPSARGQTRRVRSVTMAWTSTKLVSALNVTEPCCVAGCCDGWSRLLSGTGGGTQTEAAIRAGIYAWSSLPTLFRRRLSHAVGTDKRRYAFAAGGFGGTPLRKMNGPARAGPAFPDDRRPATSTLERQSEADLRGAVLT